MPLVEVIEHLNNLLESSYVDRFEDEEKQAIKIAIYCIKAIKCECDTCQDELNKWMINIESEEK